MVKVTVAENLKRKMDFVKDINNVITKVQKNIESIEYKVFEHTERSWIIEYLVINYTGGAKTVRECTGNSFSAIFSEISKYLEHAYYSEETDYEKICGMSIWQEWGDRKEEGNDHPYQCQSW